MSLEEAYASLTLEEEEDGLVLDGEEVGEVKEELCFCLTGCFLIEKGINSNAKKNALESLWCLVKGVCIKEIDNSQIIFQFFHQIDMNRVLENGPWTFNQHLLLLKKLGKHENPSRVELFHTSIWVQVSDLPIGFMSEKVASHIGNYIGSFLAANPKNFTGDWKLFMQVKVSIDVLQPLKRIMKIKKSGDDWVPTFYFFYGLLGHLDRFCEKFFDAHSDQIEKPYAPWLRVAQRQGQPQIGEQWPRNEPLENVDDPNFGKNESMAVENEDYGIVPTNQQNEKENEVIKGFELNRESLVYVDTSFTVKYGDPIFIDFANYVNEPDLNKSHGIIIATKKRRRLADASLDEDSDYVLACKPDLEVLWIKNWTSGGQSQPTEPNECVKSLSWAGQPTYNSSPLAPCPLT